MSLEPRLEIIPPDSFGIPRHIVSDGSSGAGYVPPSDSSRRNLLFLNAASATIGAIVTASVYQTLSTTGELSSLIISTGIDGAGFVTGQVATFLVGSEIGDTIQRASRVSSAIVRPAIATSSKSVALVSSALAGASAAFLTTGLIIGTQKLYDTLFSYTKETIDKYQGHYEIDPSSIIEDDDCIVISNQELINDPETTTQ
jgi:hypothetical protein